MLVGGRGGRAGSKIVRQPDLMAALEQLDILAGLTLGGNVATLMVLHRLEFSALTGRS